MRDWNEADGSPIWSATTRAPQSSALATIENTASGATYTLHWDEHGRLESDGALSFLWADDNLLERLESSDGVLETRVYDGFGRVVRIDTSDGRIERVYQGPEVIEEYAVTSIMHPSRAPRGSPVVQMQGGEPAGAEV